MRAVLVAQIRIVCALGALLVAVPALGHGDAGWIMDNPQTEHCCGPHDCEPLGDDAVREVKDGFLIVATGEVIHWAEGRIYTSVDDRYWWCHYPQSRPDESGERNTELRTRCLFVPGNS